MTKAVARKLDLDPGMRALIIAPPSGYLKLLKPLPEVLTPSSKTGAASPFVQVFPTRLFEISKFAKKLRNMRLRMPERSDQEGTESLNFFPGRGILASKRGESYAQMAHSCRSDFECCCALRRDIRLSRRQMSALLV